ncbi:MAG: hypothetical protein IT355_09335 [Gemmatimonadaceae bacterium]|nr:hypothetical protein [Gemmatimonadaceae bacterium]
MPRPDAALLAVLGTLLRATADGRTPVTLRTRDPAQAAALSQWLSEAHGSRRTVRIAVRGPAAIEVRLPRRVAWPAPQAARPALAAPGSARHLSSMPDTFQHDGTP